MNNQTLKATVFEYKVSYFNIKFEEILAGIIVVYSYIIASKTEIPLNDENAIRDIFLSKKDYLKNWEFRKKYPPLADYHFDEETVENAGRADIRILQVNQYKGDDAYYVIECKRLDNENINGITGLNAKYINDGIKRFTNEEKYQFYENTAGMIGFVVSKMDIHENIDCINKLLQNFSEINTEKELTKKQLTSDFEYSYYSNHKVGESTKTIYHLMFDFSNNAKAKD